MSFGRLSSIRDNLKNSAFVTQKSIGRLLRRRNDETISLFLPSSLVSFGRLSSICDNLKNSPFVTRKCIVRFANGPNIRRCAGPKHFIYHSAPLAPCARIKSGRGAKIASAGAQADKNVHVARSPKKSPRCGASSLRFPASLQILCDKKRKPNETKQHFTHHFKKTKM